ncbi:hypothetical protein BV25DRAFT_1831377 [Artomyces pyxidatus]|uniref:Uncharacterized protein n=1 Tax=Artomyces pyxidatus TaxID=48021 RepID=A0ACB8SLX8_9AGAM|nr:hypothetical protein BV25DRAFT_1831377 [Artomyces pyxidatus]
MSFAAPKSQSRPSRRPSSLPSLPPAKPSPASTRALLSVRKQMEEHKRATTFKKENIPPPFKPTRAPATRVGTQRVSAARRAPPPSPKLKPLTPTKPLHHTVPSATAARAGRSPRASPSPPKRSSPPPGSWKAPSHPPVRRTPAARPAAEIHRQLPPRQPLAPITRAKHSAQRAAQPFTPPRPEAAVAAVASPPSDSETSVGGAEDVVAEDGAFFLDCSSPTQAVPTFYRSQAIELFARTPHLQETLALIEHGVPVVPSYLPTPAPAPASPEAEADDDSEPSWMHGPLIGAFRDCESSVDESSSDDVLAETHYGILSDEACVESAIVCLDEDGERPVFEAPAAWVEACARRSSTNTTLSSPSSTSSSLMSSGLSPSPSPSPPPTRLSDKPSTAFAGVQRLWKRVIGGKQPRRWI